MGSMVWMQVLNRLKVIRHVEVGCRERVSVSRGHKDKRIGKIICLILIKCDNEGVLGVRKRHVSYK